VELTGNMTDAHIIARMGAAYARMIAARKDYRSVRFACHSCERIFRESEVKEVKTIKKDKIYDNNREFFDDIARASSPQNTCEFLKL
jgi:hypothetical protein